MVSVEYTERSLKESKKLPSRVKRKFSVQVLLLAENPFRSKLHTKSLGGTLAGFYSFRITRDYRAVFFFISEAAVKLVSVSHRKDV